jgi:lambda family phage portal protein
LTPTAAETKKFLAGLEQQAHAGDRLADLQANLQRNYQGAFRWGRRDSRTAHFMPPHRSGDAAIWESDDLMAARVRNQVLNEPQLKRIRDAIEDLIVGPGVMTFADPFDPLVDLKALLSPDTLDEYLRYALEADELFEEWFCDPKQFDLAGKRSGPEVQRMLLGENVERGGCLLVRVASDEPGRTVPLCYQIVEYDELDHSHDRPGGTGLNKIINGIELDDRGREVAFHIYDAHPYDDFAGAALAGKSSRIRAERVIHSALFRRPSQSIGVNWVHACAQPSFDRDKFVGAEIQSAAKAALLLLVWKMKNLKAGRNLGLLDDTSDTDLFGNEQMKMGNSPVALPIHADDDVEILESNRPIDTADSFLNILDHDTAGAAGISYYTLTGQYGQTSFTSVRAAKLDEDAHIRPLQNWFASHVALPIRREFHRQAIGLGLLKTVSAEDYLDNERRFNRFDAIGPGRDLLDPETETNATTGLLRSCLTTLKQACARRGQHWIRVLRQIALENHVLGTLGIALDLSKGQGGQAVGNTRSKADQEAAQQAQQQGKSAAGRKSPPPKQAKKRGAA